MRARVLLLFAVMAACAEGLQDKGYELEESATSEGGTGGVLAEGGAPSTCPVQLVDCDGICVDLTQSPNHCGGCGRSCNSLETCIGGSCIRTGDGSGGTSSAATTATQTAATTTTGGGPPTLCHPLNAAAACGPGHHCVPQPAGDPQCVSPIGFGVQYDLCLLPSDCAASYDCITTPFATTYCMQWCSADTDCPLWPLDTCIALQPPLQISGQPWGVCYDGQP